MRPLTRRQFLAAATNLDMAGSGPFLPATAVTINPRSSWAIDRPPTGPLRPEDVRFLLVHHSASRNGHTGDDAPRILRSFYDFHTGPERGWNDIAYNFLIDSDGGIWEGRAGSLDGPVRGDATGGNQGYAQLVCLIGNYNEAMPTDASLGSLVSLLSWLADRYGISTSPGSMAPFISRGSNLWPAGVGVTTSTITGHRTMSRTSCPGEHLNAYVVGELMADVDAARAAATTTTSTTASTTTTVAATASPTPVLSSATPIADSPGGSSDGAGFLVLASAIASALAALLLWRHRRLR